MIAEAGIFAADDVPALADAIRSAMTMGRLVPLARAKRLFGRGIMLDAYERLYEQSIAGLSSPSPASPPLAATS